jgi:hypothetical protein
VVLDQHPLGVGDGALDCVELLGEVHAGAFPLDHGDDAGEVTVGRFRRLTMSEWEACSIDRLYHYLGTLRGRDALSA